MGHSIGRRCSHRSPQRGIKQGKGRPEDDPAAQDCKEQGGARAGRAGDVWREGLRRVHLRALSQLEERLQWRDRRTKGHPVYLREPHLRGEYNEARLTCRTEHSPSATCDRESRSDGHAGGVPTAFYDHRHPGRRQCQHRSHGRCENSGCEGGKDGSQYNSRVTRGERLIG